MDKYGEMTDEQLFERLDSITFSMGELAQMVCEMIAAKQSSVSEKLHDEAFITNDHIMKLHASCSIIASGYRVERQAQRWQKKLNELREAQKQRDQEGQNS